AQARPTTSARATVRCAGHTCRRNRGTRQLIETQAIESTPIDRSGAGSGVLWLIRRRFFPAPSRHGGGGDDLGVWLGVSKRDARSPFEVRDQCRTKLGIVRHAGVVGGDTHQRCEAEPLLVSDSEIEMLVQHPLVAAEFLAVGGRSTEDLAPPGGDIMAMVRVYTAGKEPRQQVVAFDAVVERVD